MGDLVNLRQARKAKARQDKEKSAAQNRITHGRTKAEQLATAKEQTTTTKRLDGHKRQDQEPET